MIRAGFEAIESVSCSNFLNGVRNWLGFIAFFSGCKPKSYYIMLLFFHDPTDDLFSDDPYYFRQSVISVPGI